MKAINRNVKNTIGSRDSNRLVLYVFIILLLNACVSSPVLVKSEKQDFSITKDFNIVVVQPKLIYQQLDNSKILPAGEFGGGQVAEKIAIEARSVFTQLGYSVIDINSDNDTTELAENSTYLVRAVPKKKGITALKKACGQHTNRAMFLQTMRVKVGTSGFWNPMNGAIAPGTNTTHLKVAAVDCTTHKPLWRNAVFFRDLPSTLEGSDLNTALDTLYKELLNSKVSTNEK